MDTLSPYAELAIGTIAPSPTNPRKTFHDLEDLAASIREQGVMQPILARLWPEDYPTPEGRTERPLYEIIAGERRYRASLLAGLDTIPALVRVLNTRQVLEAQIVENLQRRDVTELEEAEGYQLMMRDHGYTADELAEKVGKSRAYIYGRLKLCALCDEARQAFRDGKLDASRGLLIARIPGATLQAKALKDITEGWAGVMSYRNAAQYIQNHYMRGLRNVIFALDDADLRPEAGPCTTCAKRPCNTPELYPDVPEDRAADVCTDTECMTAKTEAHLQRQADAAAATGRTIVRGLHWGDFTSDYIKLSGEDHDLPETIPVDEDGNDIPADQASDDDDRRPPTVAEMLQQTGAQMEIVLVEHPTTRELIECVRKAEYRQAVPVPEDDEPSYRPGQPGSYAHREAVCKAEAARRAELFTAIRARFSDGGIAVTHAAMRVIAQQFWAVRYPNTRKAVAELNHIAVEQQGSIAGWLATASPADLITLMLDLALEPATDVPLYITDLTTPAPLLDMARALGINPNTPTAAPDEPAPTPPQAPPGGDDSAKKPATGLAVAAEVSARLKLNAVPYRHPDNADLTWTGRGRKPAWVEAWLEDGGTLEDLSTPAQAAPARDVPAETPKAKPARPAKPKKEAATAAKKSKGKAKDSGRASPAERKGKTTAAPTDDAPIERDTKTIDLIDAHFPELASADQAQQEAAA